MALRRPDRRPRRRRLAVRLDDPRQLQERGRAAPVAADLVAAHRRRWTTTRTCSRGSTSAPTSSTRRSSPSRSRPATCCSARCSATRWRCSTSAARGVFLVVMGTLMIPGVVTFVPLFVLVANARADRHPAGADPAVPRQPVRRLPHAPVHPRACRATCSTPAGSTVPASCASSPGSSCRCAARRWRRWGSSPSSAAGTTSSGRWSSPRPSSTTPCRSPWRSTPPARTPPSTACSSRGHRRRACPILAGLPGLPAPLHRRHRHHRHQVSPRFTGRPATVPTTPNHRQIGASPMASISHALRRRQLLVAVGGRRRDRRPHRRRGRQRSARRRGHRLRPVRARRTAAAADPRAPLGRRHVAQPRGDDRRRRPVCPPTTSTGPWRPATARATPRRPTSAATCGAPSSRATSASSARASAPGASSRP